MGLPVHLGTAGSWAQSCSGLFHLMQRSIPQLSHSGPSEDVINCTHCLQMTANCRKTHLQAFERAASSCFVLPLKRAACTPEAIVRKIAKYPFAGGRSKAGKTLQYPRTLATTGDNSSNIDTRAVPLSELRELVNASLLGISFTEDEADLIGDVRALCPSSFTCSKSTPMHALINNNPSKGRHEWVCGAIRMDTLAAVNGLHDAGPRMGAIEREFSRCDQDPSWGITAGQACNSAMHSTGQWSACCHRWRQEPGHAGNACCY